MRLFNKFFIIFLLLTAAGYKVPGQSRVGIYAGGGVSWYYGDMNDRLITNRKLFTTYINGGLLYRVRPRWNIALNVYSGKIKGADSLAIVENHLKRNLNFTTDILEFSAIVNYKLVKGRANRPRIITPYLLGGAGYFHFNPKGTYGSSDIALQPLGTEGQYINGGGYPKPYALWQFSFPAGIGVEIYLSQAFTVRIEAANHFTLTDYLDDVSHNYPDSSLLATTPNGPLAVIMSSHNSNGYPKTGTIRGDPRQRDSFTHVGVSLLYTPVFGHGKGNGSYRPGQHSGRGRKKKKTSCPAYD